MRISTKCGVLIASAGSVALADSAPAASPAVTPRALLPRLDERTLGWYSNATVSGETIYMPWRYDADESTYSTSSTWFRRCDVGSTCTMYTGCSDGYLLAESTSLYCATGSLFCSNHVLYTTMGDTTGYSWYWCDEPPLTGYTFYAKEPAEPSLSSVLTSSASSPARSGFVTASSTTTESQTASPTPTSDASAINVGAIAGAVVGGVVGLALVGAGLFYALYRRRRTQPNTGYTTTYQANEAKPQSVHEMGGYYGHQQLAPFPQGPYDPHTLQYGGSPPPQELPTER